MHSVYRNNYIKINKDMLVIYTNKLLGDDSKRNRGDIVNVIAYLLNDLSYELESNPDITHYELDVTKEEADKMLCYNVVTNKRKRIHNIEKVKEVVFKDMDSLLVHDSNKKQEMKIPYFSKVIYDESTYTLTIDYNPQFIQSFKSLKEDKNNTNILYLDIQTSLPTLNSKIVWTILSQWIVQIDKHGRTNPTSIKYLTRHLNYTTNQHLVSTVEKCIKDINKVISEKNKNCSTKMSEYNIEWIYDDRNSSNNRKGELKEFIIYGTTDGLKSVRQRRIDDNIVVEVITYLNNKLNETYQPKGANRNAINHLVQQGYTLEQFKYVIDNKYNEWHGTDWESYIRPQTLFKEDNFKRYVEERPIKKKQNKYSYETHTNDNDHERNVGLMQTFVRSKDWNNTKF